MITADYGNITAGKSVEKQDAISIKLAGVEPVTGPDKNLQRSFPTRYSLGRFTEKNRAWLNFHWYVFRAKGTSARLTITDWAGAGGRGAPAGEQVMCNFIEVQPYLE